MARLESASPGWDSPDWGDMQRVMMVVRPGESVQLEENIKAKVLQVIISGIGQNVRYQVAWWNGNVRYVEWVEAFEVMAYRAKAVPIGFTMGSG